MTQQFGAPAEAAAQQGASATPRGRRAGAEGLRAFSGFTSLEELSRLGNEISSIEVGAFSGLIAPGTFSGLTYLADLSLAAN